MLYGWVLLVARDEAELTPEAVEESYGPRGGLGGGAEQNFSGCAGFRISRQGVGFGDDGACGRGSDAVARHHAEGGFDEFLPALIGADSSHGTPVCERVNSLAHDQDIRHGRLTETIVRVLIHAY